ncbi:indolepyruvate ferredoxin oxidoreductase, beta subunit [Thermotomaculum hydrothermale]|uniref:Indolepyruvate ferredoxin oxidoreductase, beta subunit n=1 Tax=Thermotomaculum hydrothermale TaxID=981385 RepID=A0A7R6PDS7_9BACT|nr:indolepyruvate oxidoreductase subunit beta [Thermotomaculum hydrothermale]BBB31894.1 indolepyruvate ferredoxin oxidoreductase, beta subunit [Thermotomaculum hydrothermale]
MESKNILLVGVGGQGIVLASEIMSEFFKRQGYDVKKSEVHGMAQRGGIVSSHVRIGEKVYSPMIEKGNADIMLSFEKMEALRWLYYVKKDGVIVSSNVKMVPPIVSTGAFEYPEDVEERVLAERPDAKILDIVSALKELGNDKVTNVIMIGALSTMFDFEPEKWLEVIKEAVPKKVVDVNIKAFNKGRELMGK